MLELFETLQQFWDCVRINSVLINLRDKFFLRVFAHTIRFATLGILIQRAIDDSHCILNVVLFHFGARQL